MGLKMYATPWPGLRLDEPRDVEPSGSPGECHSRAIADSVEGLPVKLAFSRIADRKHLRGAVLLVVARQEILVGNAGDVDVAVGVDREALRIIVQAQWPVPVAAPEELSRCIVAERDDIVPARCFRLRARGPMGLKVRR